MADLETIIVQGKSWLNPNGWIVLEHGYDQGEAVRNMFEKEGFSQVQTIKDYGGNDRVSLGQKLN